MTLKIKHSQWKLILSVLVSIVSVFLAYRIYQQEMAFTVGLDYFEPEFQTYWMNLLYIQLSLLVVGGAALLRSSPDSRLCSAVHKQLYA